MLRDTMRCFIHETGILKERRMPKFLIAATYNVDGIKGLVKDGGSKRREAAKTAIKSVGGKMESFYFAFGGTDAFVILDAPDNTAAAAASAAINASGLVKTQTVVLLTAEEMDKAVKKHVKYKAPGK
jgi:uncharacterized protein with GYD domain